MHICGARGDRERRITCTRLGAFARVCSFRVIVCLLQKVKTPTFLDNQEKNKQKTQICTKKTKNKPKTAKSQELCVCQRAKHKQA